MHPYQHLSLTLVLVQFIVAFSLQSIRVGRTQSTTRRCSPLLASARVDLLNGTIVDPNRNHDSVIAIRQAENILHSSLGYEDQYESTTGDDVQQRKEHTSPTTATFLKIQEEDVHNEQDDRHDDIVDSLVQHYCSIQRPSGGQGGNDRSDDIQSTARPREEGNRRANVQLPPGWGKTQLALKTLARLYLDGIGPSRSRLRSSIYVTPYLKLVDQVLGHMDRFGALVGIPHSRLIVASQTNRTEACTTSVDEIAAFLSSETHKNMPLIICTYNSLPKVGEALQMLDKSIGFGIFDEAHVMEGAGNFFGYGLHDSLLPIDHRLFLTATPRRYTESPDQVGVLGTKLDKDGARVIVPKSVSKQKPLAVRSFCDESLFGPCIERRTLSESVEQNITVPITLCALDRDEVQTILGAQYNEDKLHSKDAFLPFAVQAAFQKLNVSRAVSFHSMNSRASAFTASAGNVFGKSIAAYAVSGIGTMSAAKREEVLSTAKMAPKSIVSNCKVLATGVDEADWELVVMADPVRSPVTARQMIGRVSRKAPGKDRGYVLVPLLMDGEYGTLVDTLEGSSGYETFTPAFEAMVGLDPELRQDVLFVIDASSRLGRPLSEAEFPSRIVESFLLPSRMPLEMKNEIMNRVVAEYSGQSSWDYMFDLLLTYRDREGNCNVRLSHKEDGKKLGSWLSHQRTLKKAGELDAARNKRLQAIGVVWDVYSAQWEILFSLLIEFKQREGHCNVPRPHKEKGKKLGRWLDRQRTSKKERKLDAASEKRLFDIGVEWDVLSAQWEMYFSLLNEFKEREGHCNVPQTHNEGGKKLGAGKKLGRWLDNQRRTKKVGKLDVVREKRLQAIGVVWDVQSAQWEMFFSFLSDFKQREGHCNVPSSHKEDGKMLGRWLNTQRTLKKAGELNAAREKRLRDIGVMWDVQSAQWEMFFSLLNEFKQRDGHCSVPQTHIEGGKKLGAWLNRQRNSKRKGTLDSNREKRLTEIGVQW